MVLCFKFVMETELVTNISVDAEQCLRKSKAFSAPYTAQTEEGWVCTRIWEGMESGQLTSADPSDPSQRVPSDVILTGHCQD